MTELDRFCTFCAKFLTDEQGAPLVVEDFQRAILEDYFDGAREEVVIIGKKNGKTSLFAALALYHLLATPFADVAILAAARDQAGKLLNQLTGYIKRHPALRARLRITQRVVHCDATSGKVAVLASDSDTLDGWGGTLALVDELSRHRSEENFGLLRDGLGPRDGRLVAFSTAGDDEESALGRLRKAAHGMGVTRDPRNSKHKHIRRDGFAFHEWSLDSGDDVDDLRLVKLANPASWIDEAELRARRDSPSMRDWQWKRFTCGLWAVGENSAISPIEWARARVDEVIPEGAEITLGIDLGWKHDCTAIVPVWRTPEDKQRLGDPVILVPPRDGTSLPVGHVTLAIDDFVERFQVKEVVLDPTHDGEHLAQRLSGELDLQVVEFPQQTSPMCKAASRFATALAEGKLEHTGHEGLTAHVLAAVPKVLTDGRWRFVKDKKPIDALIAAAMALSSEPERSVYDDRGVLSLEVET